MSENMNYVKKFEEIDFSQFDDNKDAVYVDRCENLDKQNLKLVELIKKYEALGKMPYIKVGYKLEPFTLTTYTAFNFKSSSGRNSTKHETVYFLNPELIDTLNKLAANIEEMNALYNKKLEYALQWTAYTDGRKA